ncbi:hypothetical protein E2C01_033944 [Portunus trituberculatus]|uniref:Uncharacterized protein n=1 Tax=Portunus trituberculatus TaxID=210409 RepID=A0A5B7F5G0_PORTR|nr:hypothetical protein [Portunus trituberculatus]
MTSFWANMSQVEASQVQGATGMAGGWYFPSFFLLLFFLLLHSDPWSHRRCEKYCSGKHIVDLFLEVVVTLPRQGRRGQPGDPRLHHHHHYHRALSVELTVTVQRVTITASLVRL